MFNVFTAIQAQPNNVSNGRLQVWDNMILNNDVYLSVYMGYGSYSMYGMRKLQNDLVASSGLKANVNSSFPPFWLYGVNLSQRYDSSVFGFDLESMSTGARSSIADYSGQFTSDFRCSGLKLGVFIEKNLSFKIKRTKGLIFGYRLEAGGIYSNVKYQSQLIINGLEEGTQSQSSLMATAVPFIEPALFVKWQIIHKTQLHFSLGYMLDFPTFAYTGNSLSNYPIGWAGYRMKFGLVRQL